MRRLYENGAIVRIVGNDVVVTIEGVSFYARISDDLRFIGEIFYRNTYNFLVGEECCVIDIGMNIGLVSLTFARKAMVKEVHSFEPFKRTYDRARANLSLNPEIADKISAHNFGLADMDEETTVLIQDESNSGAFSIRGSEQWYAGANLRQKRGDRAEADHRRGQVEGPQYHCQSGLRRIGIPHLRNPGAPWTVRDISAFDGGMAQGR